MRSTFHHVHRLPHGHAWDTPGMFLTGTFLILLSTTILMYVYAGL